MKVMRCSGEGQGSCRRCDDKGIWNRRWMSMLFEIEGHDGCYCPSCVKEIAEENNERIELN